MFTTGDIEREARGVFGNVRVKVSSEYFINEDAVTFAVQTETDDGWHHVVSMKLSGLEQLQYPGDPSDLIRDTLQGALSMMKSTADKNGTKLIEGK